MQTTSATFEISSVPRATTPLAELPYHQAVFELLSKPADEQVRELDMEDKVREMHYEAMKQRGDLSQQKLHEDWQSELKQRRERLVSRQQAARRHVEACSRYHGKLIEGVGAHPLITALHLAFMDHRPICLSPDMLWLLICQGVAGHVKANAERLRSQIVPHSGRASIRVRRDDFIKGSPENPWDEVIGEFSRQVREYIGAKADLFEPEFSTTGSAERVAAQIVLLDAMQKYFEHSLVTACGIPSITLEGTPDDWQQLADRAQSFSQFDLEWWLTPLQPVLQELVAAARGEVRKPFWNSIYKYHNQSGGPVVTGWITMFFPYLETRNIKPKPRNRWLAKGKEFMDCTSEGDHGFHEGPNFSSFPTGLAQAPFQWEHQGTPFDMEFLGGFVGVAQDAATLALRPEIGWAVRNAIV